MDKKTRITKDTLIDELIRQYPGICKILERYNMLCSECVLAPTSTVEDAAEMHNLSLKTLLTEISNYINKQDG